MFKIITIGLLVTVALQANHIKVFLNVKCYLDYVKRSEEIKPLKIH